MISTESTVNGTVFKITGDMTATEMMLEAGTIHGR
jgi:hypothetical protein